MDKNKEFRKKIKVLLANYMASEGCKCCQDVDKHNDAKNELGKILNIPKYKDGSGYNFDKYKTIYK